MEPRHSASAKRPDDAPREHLFGRFLQSCRACAGRRRSYDRGFCGLQPFSGVVLGVLPSLEHGCRWLSEDRNAPRERAPRLRRRPSASALLFGAVTAWKRVYQGLFISCIAPSSPAFWTGARCLWIQCNIAGCDARRPRKTSAFPPVEVVDCLPARGPWMAFSTASQGAPTGSDMRIWMRE